MNPSTSILVSVELHSGAKNEDQSIADISHVHILKVSGKQLQADKVAVNFFPTKSRNVDKNKNIENNGRTTLREIAFRSIELENNLNQVREILADTDLALCVDRISAKFISELTEDQITAIVIPQLR